MVAQEARVSAYGTAAPATFWVGIEQNGPWGRQAPTESHLPYDVGWRLDRECAVRGGRLTLVRRPTAHPDRLGPPRQCLVAWSGAGAFLLSCEVVGLDALLGLDLDALGRGDLAGVVTSMPSLEPCPPVLLVCTNGKRDVCCAVRGRPVAAAAERANPGRVWECSHIGGHRFSPTGVLLPWGRTLARLDQPVAQSLLPLADRGVLPAALLGPERDRGWSAVPPGVQAAESAVRAGAEITDLTALQASWVREPAPDWPGTVEVEHSDGRRWQVAVEQVPAPLHPGSCRTPMVAAPSWQPGAPVEL